MLGGLDRRNYSVIVFHSVGSRNVPYILIENIDLSKSYSNS